MQSKAKIIFRADGNSNIGLGHVVRSLAVAEMLQADFECFFAIQQPSDVVRIQVLAVCAEIIALPFLEAGNNTYTNELIPYLSGNELVVLDGYHFNTEYQKKIKAMGCGLVCIDDLAEIHFFADVIINQADGIKPENYRAEPYTEFCLGPQFALLRPPFFQKNNTIAAQNNNRKLFLNMGGADPGNETGKILEKLKNAPEIEEIHVVIGSAYKFGADLEKTVAQNSKNRLHKNLNASEMAGLMHQCDIAICPPSSVSYEYASQGGLLFLNQTAANQSGIKAFLLHEKLAFDFEKEFFQVLSTDLDSETQKMKARQRDVFDGRSPERLQKVFKKLGLKTNLTFRKATPDDLLICFEWANDPETRANSFNAEAIPLEDHTLWFGKKIEDRNSDFYIADYFGKPVGQIRFDGKAEEKLISYLVAPEMRGLGLGYLLLQQGIKQLLNDRTEVEKISGYVKKTNKASCRIFEKAGFSSSRSEKLPYPDSLNYELVVSRLRGSGQ